MNPKEIEELIKLIDQTNIAEFKYETEDYSIVLRSNKFYECKALGKQSIQMAPMIPNMMPQIPSFHIPPAAISPSVETQAAPVAKSENATPQKKYLEIKSPIVGTFYQSSSPDSPPLINVGDTVKVGQKVCIIEAMKLFNEIESEITGTISKIMVENASPVEFDQVLFLVEP